MKIISRTSLFFMLTTIFVVTLSFVQSYAETQDEDLDEIQADEQSIDSVQDNENNANSQSQPLQNNAESEIYSERFFLNAGFKFDNYDFGPYLKSSGFSFDFFNLSFYPTNLKQHSLGLGIEFFDLHLSETFHLDVSGTVDHTYFAYVPSFAIKYVPLKMGDYFLVAEVSLGQGQASITSTDLVAGLVGYKCSGSVAITKQGFGITIIPTYINSAGSSWYVQFGLDRFIPAGDMPLECSGLLSQFNFFVPIEADATQKTFPMDPYGGFYLSFGSNW